MKQHSIFAALSTFVFIGIILFLGYKIQEQDKQIEFLFDEIMMIER